VNSKVFVLHIVQICVAEGEDRNLMTAKYLDHAAAPGNNALHNIPPYSRQCG
jgi:hypothetical protein